MLNKQLKIIVVQLVKTLIKTVFQLQVTGSQNRNKDSELFCDKS